MNYRRAFCPLAALLAVALLDGILAPAVGADRQEENKKPSLSLKATPPISFSPAKVRVVAEIRGGADDYEAYYCPTIEWDWGDGTISENTQDCDPYEAGKSTIRRRFSTDHTYRMAGKYRVFFRLKQNRKTVAATSTSVQVRPGLREQGGP
ncbi:MAG: hypothetical protein ACRD26_19680 [Vicinamibacterales bacterium]